MCLSSPREVSACKSDSLGDPAGGVSALGSSTRQRYGDLSGEVVHTWLCVHEVLGSNPGRDVWFTNVFSGVL